MVKRKCIRTGDVDRILARAIHVLLTKPGTLQQRLASVAAVLDQLEPEAIANLVARAKFADIVAGLGKSLKRTDRATDISIRLLDLALWAAMRGKPGQHDPDDDAPDEGDEPAPLVAEAM